MKLFQVPEKEKISETHMLRVLISTVCTIVLCLTCLVSTTWAWYSVSITSEGNVLQIDTWPAAGTVDETAETTEPTEETTEATENITEATTVTTEETTEPTTAVTEETTVPIAETTEETV